LYPLRGSRLGGQQGHLARRAHILMPIQEKVIR
jgi:hypothetical protein